MEIEQLKNFIAVAQLGSFQKVADQKYISQRTISKQMTNLENELGVRLFYRGSNQISLTNAGIYFAERANDLINQLDGSILHLQHITNRNLQHLRIGYFSPFEGRLLVQHIHQYQDAKTSPIQFHVSEASIEHLIADVTLGILDCAYILDYGTHEHLINSELNSDIITDGEMVLGMSNRLPLANQKVLSATDLLNTPILYYSNEESTYLQTAFLATLPKEHQYEVRRVGTIEQMQMMVALGQAIAFYPAALPLIPTNGITYLHLAGSSQHYTIRLIFRPDNNINGLKAFRKYLHDAIC